MDTKLIDWSKTILLCQAIMQRLLNAITKENERMIHLGFGSRHYNVGQNTYDFLDDMLRLNVRKRNLEDLADVVDEILSNMDEVERKVLEERFFAKKCVGELMPKMNIRTVYRHYNKALSNFAKELCGYGYTLDVLERLFAKDKTVGLIHNRVVSHAIVYRSEEDMRPQNARQRERISDEVVAPRRVDIVSPLSRMDDLKTASIAVEMRA